MAADHFDDLLKRLVRVSKRLDMSLGQVTHLLQDQWYEEDASAIKDDDDDPPMPPLDSEDFGTGIPEEDDDD